MAKPSVKTTTVTNFAIQKVNEIFGKKPGESVPLSAHIVLDLFYKVEVPDEEVPRLIAEAIATEGTKMLKQALDLKMLVHEIVERYKLPPVTEIVMPNPDVPHLELDDVQARIMERLRFNPRITTRMMTEQIRDVPRATIRRKLQELVKKGYLVQRGVYKSTYYVKGKISAELRPELCRYPKTAGWSAWWTYFRKMRKWENELTARELKQLEEWDSMSEGYGLMGDAVQDVHDEYQDLMVRRNRQLNPKLDVDYGLCWTGDNEWAGEPCSHPGNCVSNEADQLVINFRHRMRTERDDNGNFYFLVAFANNRRDDKCIAEKEELDYKIDRYTDEEDGDHALAFKLIGEGEWHSTFEGMVRDMDKRDNAHHKVVEEPYHPEKYDFMNCLAVYEKNGKGEWDHAYSYGYNKEAKPPEQFQAVKSIWHYLEKDCGYEVWLAIHLTANRERKVPFKEQIK